MQATAVVKGLGTLDFSVMAIYLVLVFALGALFARQQHSTRDFFLAGRSMGILPIALSLIATIFSAISFIAGPAAVCIYGLAMLGGTFVIFLMIPIVTKVFIPFYSRLKVYSAYEYLERRFDVRVRCLASGMFIVWRLFWMGLALYSPCLALHSAMGSESQQILYVMIITLGLVATAYTVMGGMKAVIWTDVVQFCIFFGAIGLAIIYTATHVDGGVAGIWAFAREKGRTRLTVDPSAHAEFRS
ncbi:MAG TPA: hypothetical protein PKH07_18825, partial [bacterium]|nr:hypothetical protein [bacterium]